MIFLYKVYKILVVFKLVVFFPCSFLMTQERDGCRKPGGRGEVGGVMAGVGGISWLVLSFVLSLVCSDVGGGWFGINPDIEVG